MNEVAANNLIIEYEKETQNQSSQWSVARVFKTILSITMVLSVIKMAFLSD